MKSFRSGERRIQHLLANNPMPENPDLPGIEELLNQMGTNIKLARLRRRIQAREICQRVRICRSTLWCVERGAPQVGIGVYARVLFMLKMDHEINKWGADDLLGQKIRDEELRMRQTGPWPKIPDSFH